MSDSRMAFRCNYVINSLTLKILMKKDAKTLTIEYHGGVHSRLLYSISTQKYFEFYSVLTVIFSSVPDPIKFIFYQNLSPNRVILPQFRPNLPEFLKNSKFGALLDHVIKYTHNFPN